MSSDHFQRWVPLAGPALVALALAAVAAYLRSPWHDEYFTAWAAGLSWRELVAALRLDSGPPLLYALTHVGVLAGLPALAVARALAALCVAGAAALVAATARTMAGPAAAWVAGLLLACHPLTVHWGSEARAYAVLLLSTAWGMHELVSLQRGSQTAWRLAAAVALACWVHVLGLLLALTFATVCLCLPAVERRRGLLAVGAGLGSHLPWLPVTLAQPEAAIAWMAHLWDQLPIPRSWLLALVRYLSPVAALGAVLDLPSPPLLVELAGAVLLIAVLGSVLRRPREIALPGVALAVPATAFVLLGLAEVPVFYPGRAHVLLLVPFLLLLAWPAAKAARALAGVLAAGGLVMSLWALASWKTAPSPPEALLADRLEVALPHGGTVVVTGIWRLGVAFHLQSTSRHFELVSVPAAAAQHPGWYVDGYDQLVPGELEALAGRLATSPNRVAVLVAPGTRTASELQRLATRLGLRPALSVPGGVLYLSAGRHAEQKL